jgi:hypothetical protein
MKIGMTWAFFVVCALVAFGTQVYAEGGNSSGGGDRPPPETGSAWFLGTRSVRYCLDVSADFGLTRAEAQIAVSGAISVWQEYLSSAHVLDGIPPEMHIDLNFVAIGRCDGSQDLEFLLGVSNERVETARTAYFNPGFFVQRESYDLQKGWGKGFVWVAPEKQVQFREFGKHWTPDLLRTALTHELGHVLGCAHIEGTIMRENIADYFIENERVDGQRMLVPNSLRTSWSYTAGPRTYDGPLGSATHSDTFEVTVECSSLATNTPWSATVNVRDPFGIRKYMFEALARDSYSKYETVGPAIFKYALRDNVSALYLTGVTVFGMVHGEDLAPVFGTLEFNMNSSPWSRSSFPVAIFYIENGRRKRLFDH